MKKTITTEGTGFAPVQIKPITFSRVHVCAIKHGLMARQIGMYITSPSKGGGTRNLLALLSNITGVDYPKGKTGIALAIDHCETLLEATATE